MRFIRTRLMLISTLFPPETGAFYSKVANEEAVYTNIAHQGLQSRRSKTMKQIVQEILDEYEIDLPVAIRKHFYFGR